MKANKRWLVWVGVSNGEWVTVLTEPYGNPKDPTRKVRLKNGDMVEAPVANLFLEKIPNE